MWPLFRRWLSPPYLFIVFLLLGSTVAQPQAGSSAFRPNRLLAASALPSRPARPDVVSLDDLLDGLDLSRGPKSVEVHVIPGDGQRAAVVVSVKISDLFPEEDNIYFGPPGTGAPPGRKRLLSRRSDIAHTVSVSVPACAPAPAAAAAGISGLASLSQRIADAAHTAQSPTVLCYWLSTVANAAVAWVEMAVTKHSTPQASAFEASTAAAAAAAAAGGKGVFRQLAAASGSSSVPGINAWLEGTDERTQEDFATLTGRRSSSSGAGGGGGESSSVRSSPAVRLSDIPLGKRKLLNMLAFAAAGSAAEKDESGTGSTEKEPRSTGTTATPQEDTFNPAGSRRPQVVKDATSSAASKVSATQGAGESRGVPLSNYASISAEAKKEMEAASERRKVTITDLGLPDRK